MSGSGAAHNSYVYGSLNGNPIGSSIGGNQFVQLNYDKIKNIGRMVLRTGSVTQLPDVPATWAMIYSKAGNGNIWIGGFGGDAPAVGVGIPLIEGQSVSLPCNNLNQISLIPEVDGNEIYVTAGGSGRDVSITPGNPPALDITPPTIVSTTPTNAATNQEANVLITALMSEPISAGSVSLSTVTISPAVAGIVATVDSTNKSQINLVYTTTLALSTTYTVTLTTGITDLAGNALAAPYVFTFTVKSAPPPPDTTRPTIVSSYPSGANGIIAYTDTPSVTFSKAMRLSSFTSYNTFIVLDSNQQTIPSTYSLSADLKTVYLNTTLQSSKIYDMFITNAGPTDLSGNSVNGSLFVQFITGSSSSSSTVYNVTGDTWDPIYNGGNTAVKETLGSSGSPLNGKKPTKYTFRLQKVGSPSGSVSIKIIHNESSVFTLKRSVGTIATSSIGSSETSIIVNDASNTYALAANDQISVEYTGGNSSNYIQVKTSSSDAFDGTRTYKSKTNSNGNNADYTTSDLAMTMDAV